MAPVDILLLFASSEGDAPKVIELLAAGADLNIKVGCHSQHHFTCLSALRYSAFAVAASTYDLGCIAETSLYMLVSTSPVSSRSCSLHLRSGLNCNDITLHALSVLRQSALAVAASTYDLS